MKINKIVAVHKDDFYDLDEPPHPFSSTYPPKVVVSYAGMVLKREVAAYFSLLYKLKVGGNIRPDMQHIFSSKEGRLTLSIPKNAHRNYDNCIELDDTDTD